MTGMKELDWIIRGQGIHSWVKKQRDEMVNHLAEQAGHQAAVQFEPVIDRIVRYAQLAAWFGIAGFVVGLVALIGLIAVIIGQI